MHVTLAVVVGLIVGGIVGALGYSKTAARYDAMTTALVMVNQAVEHGILKPEQVKELGELTGQTLKKDYASVASKFKFSEKQLGNASEGSHGNHLRRQTYGFCLCRSYVQALVNLQLLENHLRYSEHDLVHLFF